MKLTLEQARVNQNREKMEALGVKTAVENLNSADRSLRSRRRGRSTEVRSASASSSRSGSRSSGRSTKTLVRSFHV